MYRRALVTGGAGFVGSWMVDWLIDRDYQVVCVDDLSGGNTKNINAKAIFEKCDVRDFKAIDAVCKKYKPKMIFHLAADAAEAKSNFSPVEVSSRTVAAGINTLTAGIRNGMDRWVFVSSAAVYGKVENKAHESVVPHPVDIYGISKLAVEQATQILAKAHNITYAIIRAHNIYGPRQNRRDPYRNVVALFMNKMLSGENCVVYGDGNQKRCFSYVGDVVDVLGQCGIRKLNMVVNVGSDQLISINNLIKELARVSGKKIGIQYLPARFDEIKSVVVDHQLMAKNFNYKNTALRDGLRVTWEEVRRNNVVKPRFQQLEITSDLIPKNWTKKYEK